MKQIILERNVEYAIWENLIYLSLFSLAVFIGTVFFSSGSIAFFFSILSGIILSICLIALLIKKGLAAKNGKLYRGYFLFGKLISKMEIQNSCKNFTVIIKQYRQKYIRGDREQNWEYAVKSFEFYFIDEDRSVKNEIMRCMSDKSSEKAKTFLLENSSLKYISF